MLIRTPGEDTFGLTERQRVWGTAAGLIKFLRDGDHGILAHELYLMGEAAFIRTMRQAEAVTPPPNIAAGLTDAQYGEVYAHLEAYIRALAKKGAFLRRRRT